MARLSLFAAILVLVPAAHAQRVLAGTVTDAATGETLPGATVSVLAPDGAVVGGTATGGDGRFEVRLARVPADVAVRFLGYETARLRVTAETPGTVTVALEPADAALGEVTVTAGDDPGTLLLRRVVARVRAQRARLGPYAVTAYQRTTIYTPTGDIRGVAERSSEAFWIPGTGWRETVVASRRTANLGTGPAAPGGVAAGLQDLLAEDLDVAGHRLMGPTHRDAAEVYDAEITGTSVLDGRLVVELAVRPRRATASAFVGTLQVLFDTADVLAADLRPGASFLFPPPIEVTEARFRQQYVPVAADSSLWLPADLRSEIAVGFRVEGLLSAEPFRIEETVQLSGYRLGATAPDSLLAGAAVRRAARPDSAALSAPGVAPPLTPQERAAYAAGDSLGEVSDVLVFRGPLARIARRSVQINVGGEADSAAARTRAFGVAFAPVVAVTPAEGLRVGAALPLRAGPVRLRPLAAFRTADRGVTLGVDAAVRLARAGPARLSAVGGVFDGVARRVAPNAPGVPLVGGRGGYYRSEQVAGGLRLDLSGLGTVRQGEFLRFDTEAFVDVRYGTETASPFDTPAPDRLDFFSSGSSMTVQSLRLDAGVGTLDEPLGLLPLRALRVTAETGVRGGLGYSRADVTLDGRVVTFGRRRVLPAALDVRLAAGVSSGSVPPFRQFALEGVVPVPGLGPALAAFGALRAQTGLPPAGDRYALAAWEHSFRTLPFEVLGLRALARRQYNVLVHGAHARTWGGPLAHTRWHHEVGASVSGLFGGLRLDLTQRLDRRQTVVSVGVARVF